MSVFLPYIDVIEKHGLFLPKERLSRHFLYVPLPLRLVPALCIEAIGWNSLESVGMDWNRLDFLRTLPLRIGILWNGDLPEDPFCSHTPIC